MAAALIRLSDAQPDNISLHVFPGCPMSGFLFAAGKVIGIYAHVYWHVPQVP